MTSISSFSRPPAVLPTNDTTLSNSSFTLATEQIEALKKELTESNAREKTLAQQLEQAKKEKEKKGKDFFGAMFKRDKDKGNKVRGPFSPD